VQHREAFREPGGDLQVFRLRLERVRRERDGLVPVGDLQLALPVPLLELVVGAARLPDLVEETGVLEALARGRSSDTGARSRSKSSREASDDI
jgi:hypothetical protein